MRRLLIVIGILVVGTAAFAVSPQTGDVIIVESDTGGSDQAVVWLIDKATGDRTVLSSSGESANCKGLGQPYSCCSGAQTGDGTGACATVGSGPRIFGERFDVTVTPDRSIRIAVGGGLNLSPLRALIFQVDPDTGDRTVFSTDDGSAFCESAGVPFVCCTGLVTGDGTTPCTAVGAGPDFSTTAGDLGMHVAAVPAPQPAAVATLPAWGLALLVGVLIGVTLRTSRSSKQAAT